MNLEGQQGTDSGIKNAAERTNKAMTTVITYTLYLYCFL